MFEGEANVCGLLLLVPSPSRCSTARDAPLIKKTRERNYVIFTHHL
jgi:hypothetical protein